MGSIRGSADRKSRLKSIRESSLRIRREKWPQHCHSNLKFRNQTKKRLEEGKIILSNKNEKDKISLGGHPSVYKKMI